MRLHLFLDGLRRRWSLRSTCSLRRQCRARFDLEILERRINPSPALLNVGVLTAVSADISLANSRSAVHEAAHAHEQGKQSPEVSHEFALQGEESASQFSRQLSHERVVAEVKESQPAKVHSADSIMDVKLDGAVSISFGLNADRAMPVGLNVDSGKRISVKLDSNVGAELTEKSTAEPKNGNDRSAMIAVRAEVRLAENAGSQRQNVNASAAGQLIARSAESSSNSVSTVATGSSSAAAAIPTGSSTSETTFGPQTQLLQASTPTNASTRRSLMLNPTEQDRATVGSEENSTSDQTADIDQLFAQLPIELLDPIGAAAAVRYGKAVGSSHQSNAAQKAAEDAAGEWSYSQLASLVAVLSLAAGGCITKVTRDRRVRQCWRSLQRLVSSKRPGTVQPS